ncbi:MAG: hypothetical protein DGJ47_000945 [Rickettsiaceae bacterium]
MTRFRIYLAILCTIISFVNVIASDKLVNKNNTNDFFDQRYRGWLWLDKVEDDKTLNIETPDIEKEMQKAKEENELFTKELELMRHMMIRYPDNIEYIVAYKKKEKEMQDRALLLGRNWSVANLLNPDILNELENPQNIYGRRTLKAYQEEIEDNNLAILKDKIELFVFIKNHCESCLLLEKHLYNFASKYGFSVTAISSDKSHSQYFKTYSNENIINQLQLELIPTVIAITKDSRKRYELARGAVSIPELRQKSLILYELLVN